MGRYDAAVWNGERPLVAPVIDGRRHIEPGVLAYHRHIVDADNNPVGGIAVLHHDRYDPDTAEITRSWLLLDERLGWYDEPRARLVDEHDLDTDLLDLAPPATVRRLSRRLAAAYAFSGPARPRRGPLTDTQADWLEWAHRLARLQAI